MHRHTAEFITQTKRRERWAGGGELVNGQHCSMQDEGVAAHQQPHFANFGGFVFLALFSGYQSKGVLMRV